MKFMVALSALQPHRYRLREWAGGAICEPRRQDHDTHIVDADNTDAHKIVPARTGCFGQDKPDSSPDGKTIAFVCWSGAEDAINTQITLYDVATGTLSHPSAIPATALRTPLDRR